MSFIERRLASELLTMAKKYPVVTLIGPRQSGKSTLVKKCFSDKPYVNLEDPDQRAFAKLDPRAFLDKYPEGAIFDEIQRFPELLSYIQGIVDENEKKGFFVLTGSHQLQLQESISQSLAGRTAMLKLLPLSLSEISASSPKLPIDEQIFKGGYPRIYKNEIEPTKFYRDYVQTYVERDVRLMVNIKDLSVFRQFLKLCAGRIGQVFNSNNLSNELGVSSHTINSWLSVLEASFVAFRLQPYYVNFGKRVIKSPKLYFYDVGLATYLLDITEKNQLSRDPLRGGLIENLVICDLLKHQLNQGREPSFYFYRDSNGSEVDLLVKKGHKVRPVEIKASSTFNSHMLKGLSSFSAFAGTQAESGALIYTGDQEQDVRGVQVLNFWNGWKVLD